MNRSSSSLAVEDLIQLSSKAPGKEYGFLEDYIYELQKRNMNNNCSGPDENCKTANNAMTAPNAVKDELTNSDLTKLSSVDELRNHLCQKEKDLILAAELGKALLERNEDLTRANERITEEYSHKLEILEQEKHALRRKLDNLEGEYENRMAEMQADLAEMKKELSEKHNQIRQTEKDKADLIKELMEQNHRLTAELKQASESEDQLSDQLQSLREQFNARRSNLHDHVVQVEGLREEINILSKRKSDLEKRISALRQEREHLSMSLEESSDRILMLERRSQDQENEIRSLQSELEESRHVNGQLQNRLDLILRKHAGNAIHGSSANGGGSSGGTVAGGGGHHQQTSLFNEIEMSSSSSMEDESRSLNGHQANVVNQVDEIDCDDSDFLSDTESSWKFRQEIIEIYQQLRRICHDLSRRKENSGNFNSTQDSGVPATPEEIQISQIRAGMLTALLKELRLQFDDLLGEYYEGPCASCKTLLDERMELQKLRKEVVEQGEELKKKAEEINELSTKLTVLETELAAVKEERDNLKESVNTGELGKDEIVKRAWELRDQAVARKNTVEIELAKTRIECMHVNSQLMEAIQQKIELSQQLEQWQMDMQNLLDEQLKKKLTTQEQEEKKRQIEALKSNELTSSFVSVNNRSKLLRLWRH